MSEQKDYAVRELRECLSNASAAGVIAEDLALLAEEDDHDIPLVWPESAVTLLRAATSLCDGLCWMVDRVLRELEEQNNE